MSPPDAMSLLTTRKGSRPVRPVPSPFFIITTVPAGLYFLNVNITHYILIALMIVLNICASFSTIIALLRSNSSIAVSAASGITFGFTKTDQTIKRLPKTKEITFLISHILISALCEHCGGAGFSDFSWLGTSSQPHKRTRYVFACQKMLL